MFVTKSVIPLYAHPDSHSSKFFLPATHLTIWSFARKPQFFVVGRTVTTLSLSFASVQHVLFCSNSPLLPADFSVGLPLTSLRRASSSNLQFVNSHRSTSSQFSPDTALALTMASSIANLLSVDAGAAPSL